MIRQEIEIADSSQQTIQQLSESQCRFLLNHIIHGIKEYTIESKSDEEELHVYHWN